MSAPRTTVHLVRHGEVFNPDRVLYGRLPGFRLSERGQAMATRLGEFFADRDVASVTASPLQRAQETAAPIARTHGLPLGTEPRIIEAGNRFEGHRVTEGRGSIRDPRVWPRLWNPVQPSWGEPYEQQVARVSAVVRDARDTFPGRESVLVSHQLPVWVTRLRAEGRPLVHDPRKRQCALASVTSLEFSGRTLVSVAYTEPAADLLIGADPVPGA
ncbi:histidine phosphatase family protein [Kineococcus radiotolerans]|uniref:Phosphoglycerate mutase n=1 Tax=Kineococcus radiotolerans (strain ATCC BAA-149 / DSM 14245 / SRS30216) TaxID=266940 RepID=A6W5M7_KINRD|nr:histidine phosphatase family protein [Kineococcus radiotolerans]ABS02116.1 Phosphoglycerate mutase [Kineococcus radiotolerans SRS30216 = ATCC BAA-149]